MVVKIYGTAPTLLSLFNQREGVVGWGWRWGAVVARLVQMMDVFDFAAITRTEMYVLGKKASDVSAEPCLGS